MTDGYMDRSHGMSMGLLGSVALSLRANEYDTKYVTQDNGQLLLASNRWFIIGVAQFESVADLPSVESSSSIALSEQIVDVGPLTWDAYLLLLTSNPRDHDQVPASVSEITYNTQYHRRLIRWGVLPTEDSIARALRPFLPLQSANASEPTDPVRLLSSRMQLHGLGSDQTEMAIGQWTAEGRQEA